MVCRRPATRSDAVRILFLHGLAGRPAVWDQVVDRLGDEVEPWDAELPWHALADGTWSHRDDCDDALVSTVAAGAAGRPFDVVVAHSYSAGVLLEALAARRLDPSAVVLISPFYRPSTQDFDWTAISHYLNDFHLMFEEALRLGETARFSERRRAWMAGQMREQVGPYGWMRWFQQYLRTPFLDLSAVRVPALVITGDRDIAARPDDGRRLAAALPDGRFTLFADCGHFPMLEQPDRVARLVSGCTHIRVPDDPHLELT
ncbi:hydrolase [Protofrankia sp. BMG5.30]|nr:hydrolase [Protofrankia sp. BMG5.30]